MQHLDQPVERGVGIASAQTLDEGARRVVVIVPGPVIHHRLPLDAFRGHFQGDGDAAGGIMRRCARGNLQGIEALAGIPVTGGCKVPRSLIIQIDGKGAQPANDISDGAALEVDKFIDRKRLQTENL